MKKKDIGIIGLGKFGTQLAISLTELGHNVVGIDINEGRVQSLSNCIAAVFQGDATDKAVLQQLRFKDFNCVAMSTGQSMETSILIALNLIDEKVPEIIAKAISPQHKLVLERLGVTSVIQPEVEMAMQTAYRINSPGILDLFPFGGGTLLQKVTIHEWAGKTLMQLALPNTYSIIVVARRANTETDFTIVPNAQAILEKGDELLLIGHADTVLKLIP